MKNLTNLLFILLCLVMISLGLSSCIKEDRSHCPPEEPKVSGLTLTFTDPYQSDEPYRGLNTDEFSCVKLFIYDREGEIVATEQLNECRLYEHHRLDVELPDGIYEIVAWVGTETYFYYFDSTQSIDKASLSLYIPEDHEIDFWISHLYFGKNSFEINEKDETVIIPMLQYTNDINCTLIGLESDHQYSLAIEDDNGRYSFNNSFLPCDYFAYNSGPSFFIFDRFESRVTLLRLSDGRNPFLTLTDDLTGQIIYPSYEGQENNLINLIKSAYQNSTYDFDARHIFDLSLEFDADMRATVYIDNWRVLQSDYQLFN